MTSEENENRRTGRSRRSPRKIRRGSLGESHQESPGKTHQERTGESRQERPQVRAGIWKGRILLAALLIALAAGGIFLASYYRILRLPDPLQAQMDILPDSRAKNGTLHAQEGKEVEEGSYQVILNQIPTFTSKTRTCNIQFENPAGNQYSSRLGLYLKESGDLLGNTRLVKPGQYIETLDLNQELPVGEYPVIARIELFTGKEPAGSLQIEINIRVTETGGGTQ